MIHVFAKIQVNNFAALEKFEREAAKIMLEHQGRFLTAFEIQRNTDNSGEEIHILEFQSTEHFEQYRQNEKHQSLKELRAETISATEIKLSTQIKVLSIATLTCNNFWQYWRHNYFFLTRRNHFGNALRN